MTLVTVDGSMRRVTEDSIAIWTGARHASGKEAWDWFPRADVTWVYWSKRGSSMVTVTMPEELARDRCLAFRTSRYEPVMQAQGAL